MQNGKQLPLDQCPHCGIARPALSKVYSYSTTAYDGSNLRCWTIYDCSSCGGSVLTVAAGGGPNLEIADTWPKPRVVPEELPARAKEYLSQAISSRSAPVGAIMLMASAVDAMLKNKGYTEGSLNSRIDLAAKDHLITEEMGAWAHEIRLDANDQRHSDEASPLPNTEDADKSIEFAYALAQFLYVFPAMVKRGRKPVDEKQ